VKGTELDLTVSLVPGPRTQPILDGRVPIPGVNGHPREARSVNTNSMEMLDLKYDVAEMSLATFVKAREQGMPLIALPIFPGRRFMQQGVTYAPGSDISDPSELRGKRVGLPQFWMTSSVWHRLILDREYGVSQPEVRWVTMAPERLASQGLPPEARQDTSGRSARELMLAGELDAQMGPGNEGRGGGGGRGEGDEGGTAERGPSPVPAFPDLTATLRGYFTRSLIFPIAHLIVMKQALADDEPGLVESLCAAFETAKQRTLQDALATPGERPIPGLGVEETTALFGPDPWAYGVSKNRALLQTFLDGAREQGLIAAPMAPDALFASAVPAGLK
jgi:4,5-dihydroxyphthalate decarboxylase